MALLGKGEFEEVERVKTVEGEEGVLLFRISEELVRLEREDIAESEPRKEKRLWETGRKR